MSRGFDFRHARSELNRERAASPRAAVVPRNVRRGRNSALLTGRSYRGVEGGTVVYRWGVSRVLVELVDVNSLERFHCAIEHRCSDRQAGPCIGAIGDSKDATHGHPSICEIHRFVVRRSHGAMPCARVQPREYQQGVEECRWEGCVP